MRPTPVAAGFQSCRPGSVSRAAKFGSPAIAKGVMLSAMPLAVADLTKSRREILIVPRLYWRNSSFTRFVGIYWQQPLLAIYGRGSTRPAALRDFNPPDVRFGSFATNASKPRGMSVLLRKQTLLGAQWHVRLVSSAD